MAPLRFLLTAICSAGIALLPGQTSVTTYHNDNARTGQYLTETLLSPANVQAGRFGKRFSYPVDGEIYAQPLYVSRVNIAGKGLHDVVFVATAHDSIYAFDADDAAGADAEPLWKVNFLDEANGITSVPAADVNCSAISPELGITGTPVIDASTGALYAIAETREPGPAYVYRLHALDIASGAERSGSPVVIQAPGLVPLTHKQRGALLLSNGTVYSAWSSHCDNGEYHGFVLGNDAITLSQTGVFDATPQGNGASFWNAGGGAAADAEGNLFVVSANGDFNADGGGANYGDSVIKVSASGLAPADYFTPFNQAYLDDLDLDVGSSEAVLLPDSAGSAAHPHLLVTAGKEGRLYLLDRDHLGHAQYLEDSGALASVPLFPESVLGSAAWFAGMVFVAAQNEPLETFAVSDATLNGSAIAKSPKLTGALGAVPAISADGEQNGIAWMVTSDAALSAFDARTLRQLYDSSDQPADALGSFIEFAVPTIANGKVYVGGDASLVAYGALPASTPLISAAANAASYAQQAIAPGSLATLFGTNLSLTTASAQTVPLPLSLNDVAVTFNGIPAPLLYVSPTQINTQVPAAVPAGTAQVVVRVAGAYSTAFPMQVQAAAPGIFVVGGFAAALNQDGSVNDAAQPASPGSIVSVYLTGDAAWDSNVLDGDPASGQPAVSHPPALLVTVKGQAAAVTYAGPAPGYAGLIQINCKIPALPTGTYPLTVTIDGQASNAASISVGID